MKRTIFSLFVIASLLFAFTSCNSDKKATKEAQETMDEVISEMGDDLASLSETEAMKSMEGFNACADADDPFGSVKSTGDSDLSASERIRQAFLPNLKKSVKSTSFNFTGKVGTYTWNAATQGWDIQQNNPADKIIVKFPSEGQTSSNNDAILTISKYEEEAFTTSYSTEYQPTEITADLKLDGVDVMTIDFSAEYNTEGTPTSLTASVGLTPYSFSANMTDNGTSAKADADISLSGSTIFGAGIDITFTDDTKTEPTQFDGYITYRTIKLKGDVDVVAIQEDIVKLMQDKNATEDDMIKAINKNVSLALYEVGGDKMADIKAVKGNASDPDMPFDIVFVYPDETTESVEKYADEVSANMEKDIKALESFFESFEETFAK